MTISLCLVAVILFTCHDECLSVNEEMALYRSHVYLELLAKAEILFVKRLNESIPEIEGSQTMASEYLQAYHDNTKNLPNFTDEADLDKKARASTWNIFSVFQIVRRWVHYLKPLKELLLERPLVIEPLQIHQGFTKQDLNESMLDMLHILHAYNFEIPKAVDGIIQDVDTGTKLSAEECFELANYAQTNFYYALSIQFYEEALTKNRLLPRELIEGALNATIQEHDKLIGQQKQLHPYQRQYLFNRKIRPLIKKHGEKQKLIRIYQRVPLAHEDPRKWPGMDKGGPTFGSGKYEVPALQELCLRDSPPNIKANDVGNHDKPIPLFCWYESTIHPYFRVNPLKMELLSARPEMIRIYDLLPPSKIEAAKEYLTNTSYHNGTSYVSIHMVDSVKIEEHLTVFPVEFKLFSAFKKWDFGSILLNRIHAYTPGAKLMYHFDQITNDSSNTPVSLLYYLEEPAMGGETFFLYPYFKVKPIKGSAIFFFSTVNDGDRDYDTVHSSCPLIMGRKVVFSKIMYLKKRDGKCALNRYEKIKKLPSSKVLNQKLYPGIKKYLRNPEAPLFTQYLTRPF